MKGERYAGSKPLMTTKKSIRGKNVCLKNLKIHLYYQNKCENKN